MPKSRQQKDAMVEDIVNHLTDMKAAVFVHFSGVKIADSDALRQKCRENNVAYSVTKKTLLKLGLKKAGIDDVDEQSLEGNIATAFGMTDEVTPAKLMHEFAKDHEGFRLMGGIIEAKFINAAEVTALAQLPSKQELLAKLVGSINAPVSGLVNVLAGNLRGLVQVLNAIKETKA